MRNIFFTVQVSTLSKNIPHFRFKFISLAALATVGTAEFRLNNLKTFPEAVKDSIDYALQKVQEGIMPHNSKQLKGISPAVMEIVSSYDGNTYRSVYTVKISEVIYVLHCFQKKSKRGIKTPKQEIELIKQRLNEAKCINRQIMEKVK